MRHHQLTPLQHILLSRLARTGQDAATIGTITSFLFVQKATDEQLDYYLSGNLRLKGMDDVRRHWEHAQTETTGLQMQGAEV